MRTMLTLLLAVSIGVPFANAAEPLELEHGEQPNHLTPVSPHADAYSKLIGDKLLLTPYDYGRMIFCPSFSGEFAVSVYEDEPKEGGTRNTPIFHITLTKASQSLWYSMPNHNDGKQQPVKIQRTDVTIDRAFAVAIQRAWATMLLKTRYPLKSYCGVDGYTAEFSVWVRGAGYLYGEVWSPDRGLPKELVDLGLALKLYCESASELRRAQQKTIRNQLEAFSKKAQ